MRGFSNTLPMASESNITVFFYKDCNLHFLSIMYITEFHGWIETAKMKTFCT